MTDVNSGAAGSPDDALKAVETALETAGKAAIVESAGDPSVIAAVKLGWLIEELRHGWSLKPQPAGLQLSPQEDCQAQANQLKTQLTALNLADLAIDTAVVTNMVAALQTGPKPEEAQPLASAVIVALVGAGARYESAYVLGTGMRAMSPDAGTAPTDPTTAMVSALDMLSSVLPSHAARSVANSMRAWQQSEGSKRAPLRDAQIELWRAVIVGEKKGTELLEPEDYVKAAGQLEQRYFKRALRSRWLWSIAVPAVFLFAAGVVILFAASDTGGVVAGISAVLASTGLTWKGIGATVGKIVGKLEAPLWGAELDTAITDVITLAKPPTNTNTLAELSYANRRARVPDAATSANALPPGSDGTST